MRTKPSEGSGFSKTIRSASAFLSRMLYTHWKERKKEFTNPLTLIGTFQEKWFSYKRPQTQDGHLLAGFGRLSTSTIVDSWLSLLSYSFLSSHRAGPSRFLMLNIGIYTPYLLLYQPLQCLTSQRRRGLPRRTRAQQCPSFCNGRRPQCSEASASIGQRV